MVLGSARRFGSGTGSASAGRLVDGVRRFLDSEGFAEPYSWCVTTVKSNSCSKVLPTAHVWGGNRTARLRALRDEVAQEVNVAVAMEVNVTMDIGPSTMPLPLMPEA